MLNLIAEGFSRLMAALFMTIFFIMAVSLVVFLSMLLNLEILILLVVGLFTCLLISTAGHPICIRGAV